MSYKMAGEEVPCELEKVSIKPIKGSKKSKKSWRHADIADVEEYLEEARRDERTGGPIDDKPDEALFFVENALESDGKKTGKKNERRKKPGIEVADDDDEEYIPRKKKLDDKLKKEKELLEKQIAEARAAQVQTIWGQEVMTVTDAYLESTVKKPKVKPNTVGVGKANIDAVDVAEPGASYNPDYDSHQELLSKAHEEELKKFVEQKKLNKTVKMVSVQEMKKRSKQWLKEMSEGLSQDADESNENDESTEAVVSNPPVSSERRKTLKQRRKKLELKQMDQMKLEEKKRKVRMNDILRLKSLKREISRKTSTTEPLTKRKAVSEKRPKRLSRYKFREASINVKLSDELSGSLRELKPEGSLLNDRFKSLQRRNIIETRNKVLPRRRYKRKEIVRRSYKTATIKEFKPRR